MRDWFPKFAGARSATIPLSATAAPLPPDRRLPAAQRLNYDVFFVIFALASPNWNEAALSLSSVCRLWRYIALSMPQIWSRIDLGTSISPSNLRIILECSRPLPLHVIIPSSASKKQLKVLSFATDRIVCMEIIDLFHFLRNRFPILERLRLDHNESTKSDGLRYISPASRFPKLREFSVQIVSLPTHLQLVALRPRFPELQKLEISCQPASFWLDIIQGVSSTLVSLVLRVWSGYRGQTNQFFLPQLRHLRITKSTDRPNLTFDLDAPHLECIEHVFGGYDWAIWDGILIQLRNPRSVKQMRVLAQDFDISAYPALRMLWIDSYPPFNNNMLGSLRSQIASCPELDTILYCDPREEKTEQYLFSPSFVVFPAILDVVRETGRDISVREILSSEWDLPGDMRRSKECLRWACHATN